MIILIDRKFEKDTNKIYDKSLLKKIATCIRYQMVATFLTCNTAALAESHLNLIYRNSHSY